MGSIATGRPLDGKSKPTEGPALEFAPDGAAAEPCADSPSSLASSPAATMWPAIFPSPERDGTHITAVPQIVQRLMWVPVGRVATALGREAVDETSLADEFRERIVEQPELWGTDR